MVFPLLIMLSKSLFLLTNLLSIILIFSSSHWLLMWMSLEINMISFIAIIFSKNSFSSESIVKYFIIQSFASYLFISFQLYYIPIMIMISLLIKLGASPFHIWFPQISESLSWPSIFLFVTTQKLPPLFILQNNYSPLMLLFIMMSIFTGSMGGLKQTSLRKIILFSSIAHLGWILSAVLIHSFLWLPYLILYSIIIFSIIMNMSPSMTHFHQLSFQSHHQKISVTISFLSLGGMPPFLGFLPKILILSSLISSSFFILPLLLVSSSLVNLFFYCRVIIPSIFTFYSSSLFNFHPSSNIPLFINCISLFPILML